MNENDEFIYSYTHKMITQIVSKQNEATIKAIQRYCEENDAYPNIIDEDKLNIILKLGIAEYNKRYGGIDGSNK